MIMPRLNHKKARTGCQRCKARKVKCDEGKPKCIACTRHNVPCEYVEPAPRRSDPQQQNLPSLQQQTDPYGALNHTTPDFHAVEQRLELQLMRQWNKLTSQSFCPDTAFWRDELLLLALDHRMVLDAMYALSALHASRLPSEHWVPLAHRARPVTDHGEPTHTPDGHSNGDRPTEPTVKIVGPVEPVGQLGQQSRHTHEMLLHARRYFDRAISSHTTGIQNLSKDNIDAVYHTSILLSLVALFGLSEPDDDPALLRVDPLFWTRLAQGIRYTADISKQMVGDEVVNATQISLGDSTLPAAEQLFQREQGKPFEALLSFGLDHEPPAPEDRVVYQQAVAYLALTYKSITESSDPAIVNCWRLIAMPSVLPRRFGEMIEYKLPRALTILAYMFAVMKLVAKDIPWLQGIAERQVPLLDQSVPPAWKELTRWPIDVALADATRPEVEAGSNKVDSVSGTNERLEEQVFRDLLTRDPAASS